MTSPSIRPGTALPQLGARAIARIQLDGTTWNYLLANPCVMEAIAERMRAQSEKALLTADMVIEGLLNEAFGRGRDTSTAARVSAWRELGRVVGIFEKDNSQRAVSGIVLLPAREQPFPPQNCGSGGDRH